MKKLKIVLAAFCIVTVMLVYTGCRFYKEVKVLNETVYNNQDIEDNVGNYDIYIHSSKSGTYQLKNPSIDNYSLKGTPILLSDSEKIAQIKNPKGSKQIRDHKNDLNIYTDKQVPAQTETASITHGPSTPFELKKEEIKEVKMYALDKKKTYEHGAWWVLLFVLGLILVLGLVYALIAGSTASGKASGNSSGNSNSNSGTSSGGGGSKSGCYIATMVYGSYEAPEVMVLRRYRDESLSKSMFGRGFIKYYYRYSPIFVEKFKNNRFINSTAKYFLDKWVKYLQK